MNFWKLLRWASAAIFILLILVEVLVQGHFDFPNGNAPDVPRPAPIIVH
jgi:hypothetical protein